MREKLLRIRIFLVVAACFVASCSTMPRNFEPPRVSIADLSPKDMAIFEQRFEVQLRIQNPNDTDISINGIRCDIELNDRAFGNGMSGQKVTVPRFGSETVNVEVITSLGSFLRQAKTLGNSSAGTFTYRLKGTAYVEAPGTFKVPFDEKGEIDMPVGATSEK